MQSFGIRGIFVIGALLLLYTFTVGRIWDNDSVQIYLVFCTGIISINLGLLALALTSGEK